VVTGVGNILEEQANAGTADVPGPGVFLPDVYLSCVTRTLVNKGHRGAKKTCVKL
jgi:hypothetical protein